MAARHDTSPPRRPDPSGRPRPDLLLSFLGVASSALRKAGRHTTTEDLARLTAEAEDRVARAAALAGQAGPPRPRQAHRSA